MPLKKKPNQTKGEQIVQLEFELSYYNVALWLVNQYVTWTSLL